MKKTRKEKKKMKKQKKIEKKLDKKTKKEMKKEKKLVKKLDKKMKKEMKKEKKIQKKLDKKVNKEEEKRRKNTQKGKTLTLKRKKKLKTATYRIIASLIASILTFLIYKNYLYALIVLFAIFILTFLYTYYKIKLEKSARIRKIESVFPDFLQLMSSNLRAGMTIDKAMILSSRKEFSPLDGEIIKTGKDIATGKNIETSLLDLSKRIGSEKIKKTILLIISGIKAGGNLAVLLEQTSVSMKERNFVEKRAASSVLMYVLFIFLAVSVGAPALFSLSNILVETLSSILGTIPDMQASVNLPFTLSSINISITFIKYFSLIFIITIDILASLIIGLVSKGDEKQGLRYLIPILTISIGTFFAIRYMLSGYLSGLFG